MSDHFNGKRFFNPTHPQMPSFGDLVKLLTTYRKKKWPSELQNATPSVLTSEMQATLQEGEVVVTFINHATLLVQTKSFTVITDPVFVERASPVRWAGPKRARKPAVPLDQLPKIDYVLISHNHYDHLDLATVKRLKEKFDPEFLVAMGDQKLLQKKGISKVRELDWWDSVSTVQGAKITFTPTQHFAGRTPFDRNRTLWGAYFVEVDGVKYYFGGDAGYSVHYQTTRAKLGSPDLALLPIGAYDPRWFMKPVHMNPEEAVIAHQDIGAKKSVGIHYGTFQLTEEAIDQPVMDLGLAKKKFGIDDSAFVTLPEGQATHFQFIP